MTIAAIIALLVNLISVSIKLEFGRYADAAIDAGIFIGFLALIGDTASGFIITTIASAFFSVYLFFALRGKPNAILS